MASKAALAEFIGTALFQFLGGAAVANVASAKDMGLPTAALGNGLALAVCIYLTVEWRYFERLPDVTSCSGGHLNPAVTLCQYLRGKLPESHYQLVGFIVAQLLGAIIGSWLLWLLLPQPLIIKHVFTTGGADELTVRQLGAWEFTATFVLLLTVCAVCEGDDFASTGPLAIGLAVSAGVFAMGPFTGAALNPARTLGPAITFGVWEDVPYFLAAQLVAAVVVAFFFEKVIVAKWGEDDSVKLKSSQYV